MGGVKITNRNGNAIKEMVARLEHRLNVKVGITAAVGSRSHGGATILDIAGFHEFGTVNIPARSWLRGWFDENETEAQNRIRKGMQKVIAGEISIETLGYALGLWAQTGIQARISAGIAPALAAETVAKKGSSTPLIDTNVFRSSITFVVESGEMLNGVVL